MRGDHELIHQSSINTYRKLLQNYQIEPEYIEDFGKVKKVYSKRGTFALKKTMLTEQQRINFTNTIQNIHQRGYRHAVPIFPTTTGDYLFQEDGNIYYLMPWIESTANRLEVGERQVDLMKLAARFHAVTATKTDIKQDNSKNFYENTKNNLEKRRLDYERYIDRCEKKLYMSPYELLYCTFFNHFMKMEQIALRWLEEWYILASEKKQDRIVICHGNLSANHLLYDENGQSYFTSFDRSFIASPIYDLLYYFKRMFYQFPQSASKATEWYSHYNRQNYITEDERLLLFYYLTETSKIHRNIQQYQVDRTIPEKSFVAKLQRSIWQIQAAHAFVDQLNHAIEEAKAANLENTDENVES